MFFLGIQPNTDLEHRLLEEGYLSAGYITRLMLTPSIRKLLYNPARSTKSSPKLAWTAWEQKEGSRDPRMDRIPFSNTPPGRSRTRLIMPMRISFGDSE